MDYNRRNFLKGISLTAFAGAASPSLMAEGTTLVLPEMANGRLKPGKLQEVDHEVDLCVVGGGMGGMLTAISAARRGAKVALMHDRPVLGGNASSEIRMWICGAGTRVRNLQETGIMEEISRPGPTNTPPASCRWRRGSGRWRSGRISSKGWNPSPPRTARRTAKFAQAGGG